METRLKERADKEESKRAVAAAKSAPVVTETLVWSAHLIVSFILPIALPVVVLHSTEGDPLPSVVLVLCSITLWMKLISYAQCNWDLRYN